MTATVPGPGLSAPPAGAGERWRAIPRRWRVVLAVLAALVGLELASSLVGGLGSNGSGSSGPSSSYDAGGSGTEALGQLLVERGYAVHRLTVPLDQAAVAPGATIFVLDPTGWTASQTAAVRRVVAAGDRVVLGGRPPSTELVAVLLGPASSARWQAGVAGATHPVASVPLADGIDTIVSDAPGTYGVAPGQGLGPGSADVTAGPGAPLFVGPGGVLALAGVGTNPAVLIGSSSPLHNDALDRADNAAFGLRVAGAPGSTVYFDEYHHGFGRPGTGLAGLSASWRWGLGIALLAVLVWLLSAARRFGPPERRERTMIPARVEYVDAMATLLATRPVDRLGDVLGPVVDEICRLDPSTAAPAVPASDAELVELGRRLSSLERHGAGR